MESANQVDDCEWFTKHWTKEEKDLAGHPENRIKHRRRLTKSVDEFEKRIDLEMYGFNGN